MFLGCEASRESRAGWPLGRLTIASTIQPGLARGEGGRGGSLQSHQVGGRRSLVSSSEVVPVDSMGPSACQTVCGQAVLWLVSCVVLVLITKKTKPRLC